MKALRKVDSSAIPVPVARVLAIQCAVTLLGVAGFFYDRETGCSALAGGLLALIPNVLAAAGLFRRERPRAVRDEGRRMRTAQAIRWIATLAGFAAVFAWLPGVLPVPLFATYVLVHAAPLVWHMWDTRN